MTASSNGCTPLFLNALPHSTAVIWDDSTARRIAICNRSGSIDDSSVR